MTYVSAASASSFIGTASVGPRYFVGNYASGPSPSVFVSFSSSETFQVGTSLSAIPAGQHLLALTDFGASDQVGTIFSGAVIRPLNTSRILTGDFNRDGIRDIFVVGGGLIPTTGTRP